MPAEGSWLYALDDEFDLWIVGEWEFPEGVHPMYPDCQP